MDGFHKWPQSSYFVLYSHINIIQVCPQGVGVERGYSLVGGSCDTCRSRKCVT